MIHTDTFTRCFPFFIQSMMLIADTGITISSGTSCSIRLTISRRYIDIIAIICQSGNVYGMIVRVRPLASLISVCHFMIGSRTSIFPTRTRIRKTKGLRLQHLAHANVFSPYDSGFRLIALLLTSSHKHLYLHYRITFNIHSHVTYLFSDDDCVLDWNITTIQ